MDNKSTTRTVATHLISPGTSCMSKDEVHVSLAMEQEKTGFHLSTVATCEKLKRVWILRGQALNVCHDMLENFPFKHFNRIIWFLYKYWNGIHLT